MTNEERIKYQVKSLITQATMDQELFCCYCKTMMSCDEKIKGQNNYDVCRIKIESEGSSKLR